MPSDKFEKALDDFLQTAEYDVAESALYVVTRAAFLAGWKAASGEQEAKVISPFLDKTHPKKS